MEQECFCLKSKYAITEKGSQFLEQTLGGATGLLIDVEVSALMDIRENGDIVSLLPSIRKYRTQRGFGYTPPEKIFNVIDKLETRGLIKPA